MVRAFILAVVVIFLLQPAYALNCSLYYGDYHNLCWVVKPLPIQEQNKQSLMNPNLYGEVPQINKDLIEITPEPIKEKDLASNDNLILAVKIAIFFLINYSVYSILTKSSFILKWLSAVSLT